MMGPRRKGVDVPEMLVEFIDGQYARVEGTLALYTGDPLLAQDLTQETFIRVCQRWGEVQVMAAPGPWVHRVAMNLANSSHRRRGAERRAYDRSVGGAAASPDGPVDHGCVIAADVRAAVLELALAERAVVVLRFFADLSVEDTAVALGIPVGTVKTRTRRACEALRASGFFTEVMVDE